MQKLLVGEGKLLVLITLEFQDFFLLSFFPFL